VAIRICAKHGTPKVAGRKQLQCKKCNVEYATAWRNRNRQTVREYARKWDALNPGKKKSQFLKSKYGITIQVFEQMAQAQEGKCDICRKTPQGTLYVDHSHKSGKVRALLCNKCNTALGFMDEDIDRFLSAANYLAKHKER
jgi:hypothetical protein